MEDLVCPETVGDAAGHAFTAPYTAPSGGSRDRSGRRVEAQASVRASSSARARSARDDEADHPAGLRGHLVEHSGASGRAS